jgi:hypothetical protein
MQSSKTFVILTNNKNNRDKRGWSYTSSAPYVFGPSPNLLTKNVYLRRAKGYRHTTDGC